MATWILAPVPATPLMRDGSSAGIAMRHDADQAEHVGVRLQAPDVRDEREEHHEHRDAEHRVDDLGDRGRRAERRDRAAARARVPVTPGLVEPVDHHDAEAVEQRRDRQQQRVGVWRPAADREVRAEDDDDERDHVLHEGGRVLALEAEAALANANATMPQANRTIHSSVERRLAAPPPAARCPAPGKALSCCSRGRRGRRRTPWVVALVARWLLARGVGVGGGCRGGVRAGRGTPRAERRGRGAVGRVGHASGAGPGCRRGDLVLRCLRAAAASSAGR